MKKLLFLLFFPLAINAQITLSGSPLVAHQAVGLLCITTMPISVNGTYSLDGTFNGKNQYSMPVSVTHVDGVMCYNGTAYDMTPTKFYIRWSITNNNWELGFNGFNITPLAFRVMSTVAGTTIDPPCGAGFGGTIAGTSCTQACTNSMIVGGSATICNGASTTLSATGCSGTVTWNNSGGTGTSISVSPNTTTIYTAICSTAGVCAATATVTVNYTIPAPELLVVGDNGYETNATICAGTSIILYCGACYLGGVTFNWSNGTTTNGNSSAPFIPVASSTYTATQTLNGCTSAISNTVSVTVNPIVQVSASNSTICSGASTTLTATGCSGGTITWDNNGGTGTTVTVSPTNTTLYTATCSIAEVCSGTATITVNYSPSKPVINSNNTSYCSGTTAILSAYCNNGSILWNNGATTNQIGTTSNDTFTAICTENGCTSPQSNSFPINFHTTPIIGGATCVGSMLTATGAGAAPLQWLKDGVELTGATTATFTPTQSGIYQVVTTSLKGSWTPVSSPTNLPINGVYFIDAAQGWIVGGSGIIYKTTNGGTSWTQQTSGVTTYLQSVFFTNSNNGVAVGNNGVILRTTDGGTSWTSITSNTTNALFDVYFVDANNGWAVGGQYIVLKTTNGGASWTTTSIDNAASTSDYYWEVQFSDANTGYVSGGKSDYSDGFVRKTSNGGTTWTNSFSSTNSIMYGLSVVNNKVWAGGTIYGYAPYAQKTSDGGNNWSNISLTGLNIADPIKATYFVDANRGWFIASNNYIGNSIFSTRDGGTSFTRESISNATQASSIAISRDIFMLPDGNSGWIVGYNPSYGTGFLMKFSNKVCMSNALTINASPTAPTLNLTGTQTICPSGSVALIASACSGTVNWSNGSTGSAINVTLAGTYSASCTNPCGTSASSTQVIVVVAPATLILSGNAINGTQQAGQGIVSTQTINTSANTSYKAGKSVTLEPTFNTQTGAIFKAEIGGCN